MVLKKKIYIYIYEFEDHNDLEYMLVC